MAHPYLRVYFGPECDEAKPVDEAAHRRQVTVPLGEVAAALADAVNTHRAWLGDFQQDELTISLDLYQVLLAYQELRPTG